MKKLPKNKLLLLIIGVLLIITLSGCTMLEDFGSNIRQQFAGLPITLQTYDYNAQKIDEIKGKSLSIRRDTQFDEKDKEGETTNESKVMKITVGEHLMRHVGSSLIAYQDGLTNVMDKHSKKVEAINNTRAMPFINRFIHTYKDDFSGSKYVILIRSQTGKPIATFAGEHVRVSKTDVPSSTNFLINGKRLFIYRCDYTIYEQDMLDE